MAANRCFQDRGDTENKTEEKRKNKDSQAQGSEDPRFAKNKKEGVRPREGSV